MFGEKLCERKQGDMRLERHWEHMACLCESRASVSSSSREDGACAYIPLAPCGSDLL